MLARARTTRRCRITVRLTGAGGGGARSPRRGFRRVGSTISEAVDSRVGDATRAFLVGLGDGVAGGRT